MIRFDYVRSARPRAVRRILEYRLPKELGASVFALVAVVAIVIAAWMIESYRLAAASATEIGYRSDFEQSQLALSKAKVLHARLERIVALLGKIYAIKTSGERQASRFADISNRLPPHVWLTTLGNDESGVALSGKAANLGALSRTIADLTGGRRNYVPELLSAAGDDHAVKVGPFRYELRLESGR